MHYILLLGPLSLLAHAVFVNAFSPQDAATGPAPATLYRNILNSFAIREGFSLALSELLRVTEAELSNECVDPKKSAERALSFMPFADLSDMIKVIEDGCYLAADESNTNPVRYYQLLLRMATLHSWSLANHYTSLMTRSGDMHTRTESLFRDLLTRDIQINFPFLTMTEEKYKLALDDASFISKDRLLQILAPIAKEVLLASREFSLKSKFRSLQKVHSLSGYPYSPFHDGAEGKGLTKDPNPETTLVYRNSPRKKGKAGYVKVASTESIPLVEIVIKFLRNLFDQNSLELPLDRFLPTRQRPWLNRKFPERLGEWLIRGVKRWDHTSSASPNDSELRIQPIMDMLQIYTHQPVQGSLKPPYPSYSKDKLVKKMEKTLRPLARHVYHWLYPKTLKRDTPTKDYPQLARSLFHLTSPTHAQYGSIQKRLVGLPRDAVVPYTIFLVNVYGLKDLGSRGHFKGLTQDEYSWVKVALDEIQLAYRHLHRFNKALLPEKVMVTLSKVEEVILTQNCMDFSDGSSSEELTSLVDVLYEKIPVLVQRTDS
ncbi:MAG: hypothetical protein DHS80DRAFT_28638 [Piptocephalis tieghemiana]|nr:MAG: hypothetical protein DHS80DRAFT_28638 [Piptocephalis tieghemiana]